MSDTHMNKNVGQPGLGKFENAVIRGESRLMRDDILAIQKQEIDDYVALSRSVAKAHDNLTRWIIASASVHVGGLVAIIAVAVGR